MSLVFISDLTEENRMHYNNSQNSCLIRSCDVYVKYRTTRVGNAYYCYLSQTAKRKELLERLYCMWHVRLRWCIVCLIINLSLIERFHWTSAFVVNFTHLHADRHVHLCTDYFTWVWLHVHRGLNIVTQGSLCTVFETWSNVDWWPLPEHYMFTKNWLLSYTQY